MGCLTSSGTGTSGLVVLVVTDVSLPSVVTEVCDGFSLGSDGQPLSLEHSVLVDTG